MFESIELKLTHEFKRKDQTSFKLSLNDRIPLNKGIVGLYGGSGQGKSTLLKSLSGSMEMDYREVIWRDEEGIAHIFVKRTEENPAVYQDQHVLLFENKTVEQNLDLVVKHSNWRSQLKFTKRQVIAWSGIQTLLKQNVSSLSGGEKQRVGFARSLLCGKQVIFLDEPFSALDWYSRQTFLALLKKLNREHQIQIIIVSHSLHELALCSDYLIQMESGVIKQKGELVELLPSLTLESSEPLFARLLLQLEQNMTDVSLSKWQLGSSVGSYIFTQESESVEESEKVVTLDARAVSLTQSNVNHSSMLNHLKAKIIDIGEKQHLVLVTLEVEGQIFYSLISQLSLTNLALRIGDNIYAQFKAI